MNVYLNGIWMDRDRNKYMTGVQSEIKDSIIYIAFTYVQGFKWPLA